MQDFEKEVECQCVARLEVLEAQYQSLLADELNSQHDKLCVEFDRILKQKDDEVKKKDLEMQRNIDSLAMQHQAEMESTKKKMEALSQEIWERANLNIAMEAEQELSQIVKAKDEQISVLREERDFMQRQLHDTELQLNESVNNLAELDQAFLEVAREINTRHQNEIECQCKEKNAAVQENERIRKALHASEASNASLTEQLHQIKLKNEAIELKYKEQEELVRSLNHGKRESQNHQNDNNSCRLFLERQMFDLKAENHSLSKALEEKSLVICELTMENKQQTSKVSNLNNCIEELREKNYRLNQTCVDKEKNYTEATILVESLEQEKRRYTKEMEYRLRQKEEQLTEALGVAYNRSTSKPEPVVVHLQHGNNGESQKR